MRMPIVRTMRQPPESVPSPIAAWQDRTTQSGTCGETPACTDRCPVASSAATMMPAVFCASLPPWPIE